MVEMTIGVDLGDVWSHYCTLNQGGEVVIHSIWISEQLQELGHEVIVAKRPRAASHIAQ
jgi:transposase